MSWPRGSLLAALLVLSIPLASADTITVNTTTDDDADNSLCSLREAVEYFNLDKPADGYQGCVSASDSSSDSITVPANTQPYVITSAHGAIVVRRALSIIGGGNTGDPRTIVKVEGDHRAFVISDDPLVLAPDCAIITPLHPAQTCSTGTPATAPQFAVASDSLPAGDFLTTTTTPIFSGQLSAPATGTAVTVTLYDTPLGGTATAMGSTLVDAAGVWSIESTIHLAEGVHDISFTTKVDANAESDKSLATRIGVYVDSPAVIDVTLSQMEIQGCATGATSDCANSIDGTVSSTSSNGLTSTYTLAGTQGKGGIIYSNEDLSLDTTTLHHGIAPGGKGGAVYATASSIVLVQASHLHDNKADAGAAIFMERNSLFVSKSLFSANEAATATGAVVALASGTAVTGSTTSLIVDSTFSGNTGSLALSLHAGAVVNASTIVLNGGGIDFHGEKVGIYNSILAANPDGFPLGATTPTDCQNLSGSSSDIDFRSSVGIVGGGCDAAPSGLTLLGNLSTEAPEEKLMASQNGGKCVGYIPANAAEAAFKDMGVLCPLLQGDDEDVTLLSHVPRLLASYSSVADSPIVAKGTSTASSANSCTSTDQRTKARRPACDIGAVETQPLTSSVIAGNAISYGQTYTELPAFGDEQLLVPTVTTPCPAFALTLTADEQKAGCPWITIPPSRGTVVFNADGTYTYTPSSNFHGFDRFSYRAVTTLSKLNSTPDGQSRLVNVQIIVEPASGLVAYSTAGSADVWLLLSTVGLCLAGLRRRDSKEKTSC